MVDRKEPGRPRVIFSSVRRRTARDRTATVARVLLGIVVAVALIAFVALGLTIVLER